MKWIIFILGTILLTSCIASSKMATPIIPKKVDRACAYYKYNKKLTVPFAGYDKLFQVLKEAKCTHPLIFGTVKTGSLVMYVDLETELGSMTFSIPYCDESCKEVSIADHKNKLIYYISDSKLFQEINSLRKPVEEKLEQVH